MKVRKSKRSPVHRMMLGLLFLISIALCSLVVTIYTLSYKEEVVITTKSIAPWVQKHTGQNITRKEAVVNAIQHAWRGYAHYGLNTDELMPLSLKGRNNMGHLQTTLVDSLDALLLANLTEEYNVAKTQLEKSSFAQNAVVNTLDVTMRLLGGSLSAYEATRDTIFLKTAIDIGNRILGAFNTPSHIPTTTVHMILGHPNVLGVMTSRTTSLSTAGSVQMELSHLSYSSHTLLFREKGQEAYKGICYGKKKSDMENGYTTGLFPIQYNIDTGDVISGTYFTMGSTSGFYQSILKVFILEGGNDNEMLELYINAMDSMIKDLVMNMDLFGTTGAVVIDVIGNMKLKRMSSTSCFIPGMLALGAQYGRRNRIPELEKRYDTHMEVAKKLMKTCVYFYEMNSSGLSAQSYEWKTYHAQSITPVQDDEGYKLQSETVESLFILYRVTKNNRYRDQGWKIFQNIEKHCKTKEAYAAVEDVTVLPSVHTDHMFFIIETLKYLQLLFSEESVYPLDKFVFTAGGHPLHVHHS